MNTKKTDKEKDKKALVSFLFKQRNKLEDQWGRDVDQKELAAWYDIDYQTFNKYYKGERFPSTEFLHKIGAKTPEVYDFLGMERPDPRILELQELYKDAPDDLKDRLFENLKRVFEDIRARPLD